MCGNKELDYSSDSSSDSDVESLDSFRSRKTEKVARKWAYCVLICYTVAAIGFMTIFIIWICTNSNSSPKVPETD